MDKSGKGKLGSGHLGFFAMHSFTPEFSSNNPDAWYVETADDCFLGLFWARRYLGHICYTKVRVQRCGKAQGVIAFVHDR